ncbi:hypothetical protein [Anabaenopsis elenkinii]|uniref:ATP-citrate lyase/succinyl-CoA ligase domain-containing protein n=1 Tax=Anabaenopsis elenkinii CCIBt3563 TaxID=2779889 RepID=A0A7S6REA3_9CYAN|nr:hypothetical protein [Anabaenopsis elenkinii]QOV23261.1 hypothetical protein IM676_02680 [Anabaenopsis elenkinii CCIBt3563]
MNILAADKSVQVILINLIGGITEIKEVARIISNFVQQEKHEVKSTTGTCSSRTPRGEHFPSLVVRIAGSEFAEAKQLLGGLNTKPDALIVLENLDEAVAASVSLTRG